LLHKSCAVSLVSSFVSNYVKDFLAKLLECSDFQGIAISNIISKCFEYCLLTKFSGHFNTNDNQFDLKSAQGCGHAIYTARKIIDVYVIGGDTYSTSGEIVNCNCN
jgi:hypothetical protein